MNPKPRPTSPGFLLCLLFAIGAFLAAGAPAAFGQTVFTFTATADASVHGYTSGSSYTFIFTANTGNPGLDTFGSSQNKWLEETLGDTQLVTAIGGTGLLNSYVRPTSSNGAPYSNVTDTDPNQLSLLVRNDDNGSLGIQTLDGTDLWGIQPSSTVASAAFTFPGTSDFSGYWAGFVGDYPSSSGTLSLFAPGFSTLATFSITDVSISAVPEPADLAAIFGLLALMGGIARRRRQRAAASILPLNPA